MMTYEEADAWSDSIITGGTYPDRTAYRKQFGVGTLAETLWKDETFTYGMEYGILIAIEKIFGNLKELSEEELYG